MSTGNKKAQLKSRDTSYQVKKTAAMASGSEEDSDVDMETNFALLTKNSRGFATGGEEGQSSSRGQGGEDEETSDEDGSEGGRIDEEGGSGCEEDIGQQTQGNDDDDDDDDDDDEDDDGEEEDDDDGGGGDGQAEGPDGGRQVQTEEDIKKELSSMSFEEVIKLKKRVGTKVYNKIAYGSEDATRVKRGKKRLNKNRPVEVSSKRHVPFLREVIPVKKTVNRDPRFDDLSGEYKPEIFEKTYKFVNDIRQSEMGMVKKQLKKTREQQKKQQLKSLLDRMENQERSRRNQEEQREKEITFRRQQRELASQGLQPFYLNKTEQKKLQLAEKYQQLKRSGKLENFLSKKRKRNATKDRKKLPYEKQQFY